MPKLKRLRRREAPVDVHSEDEEEYVTRGELELSDISDSEASCEDSDVESEASHSEGEETQEETSIIKEESTTTEELNLTKEKETNSTHEEANSLAKDIISTSSEDIARSKEAKKSNQQKSQVEDELELKDNSNTVVAVFDDDISSSDGDEELQGHSGDENEAQDEKRDDSRNSANVPEMTGWQKKVLARQEYRKKLAEDPAFVPHLGEFWGHDDRFIKDEFKDDFDSRYRKPSFSSRGKGVWGNPPSRERWDHDGFEELMKIEDEEKRKKEFRRRIQHRREFASPASRYRSHLHNVTPPKFNNSRPSNSIRMRRNLFEEQPRSKGIFLSKYDTRNKRGDVNSNNFNQYHRSSENGSKNSSSSSNKTITKTTSGVNDNKSFAGKDNSLLSKSGNGFRGRSNNSRHYIRSSLDQSRNSKEQHLNNDEVNNVKDSHVINNAEQHENHKIKSEVNINTAAEHQTEKAESAKDLASHVNISTSEETKSEFAIKEQENTHKKSNEEAKSEIILDPQNKKTTEDSTTTSISQSIDNVTSSINDLSINNNQSEISSTTIDKDRAQASKRYSTRRTTSSSITQPTQTNDSPVNGVSSNSRTSEIPPSAVYAPPFQPRALAPSDENSVSNEDYAQKPETPVTSYMDNLPQGLRNNHLSENSLPQPPQPTSVPTSSYVTESNGMVYYYDPNMYYYYYPTSTSDLKDANDNSSIKSPSFAPQLPNTIQENNGNFYYYYPVYYQ